MLNSNPLLSLPLELSSIIYKELEPTDLKQIRLTCKTLAINAAPLVLSHIIISGERASTIEEVVSDLQYLTKPEGAAVNCSNKITFKLGKSISHDIEIGSVKRTSEKFFTALTSFRCVQTVKWHTGANDPLWLQESIWKAIGVFSNLRHLKIESSFLDESLRNFDSLKALESINISGNPFSYNGALFFSIARLYASSSNLSSITISGNHEKPSRVCTFQHLFPGLKDNPARLRHLSLSNVLIRFNEVSLSHLTHLTSLKLSSLPYFTENRHDDIWVALRQSKICLEELEAGHKVINDSLIDYLSSFSGLKKLNLSIPASLGTASAVKFWSDCFPNHLDKLQDFSLEACYDDKWCFGDHNRSLVATCTNLRRIKVSLLPDDTQ